MPASSILLKEIPETISDAISREQQEIENNTGRRKNKSQTVIKMIKDYLECRKNNNFKPKYNNT